jgi:hypothetical protein
MYDRAWHPFRNKYTKIEYDIKCKDGTIYEECWPNAGHFHHLEDGTLIKCDDVAEIRLTQDSVDWLNTNSTARELLNKGELNGSK